MQVPDEQTQEMTYAARPARLDSSIDASPAAMPRHVVGNDAHPSDRNSRIYSYVTLVAERCHDARMTHVIEANSHPGAA